MRRWWLAVALLLSLGINVGLVSVAVVRRLAIARWEHGPGGEPPPPELVGRRFADELRLPPGKRVPFLAAQRRLAERTFDGRRDLARLRDDLRREVAALTPAIAAICARLPENVHILYQPDGAGRVAFGGRVVSG